MSCMPLRSAWSAALAGAMLITSAAAQVTRPDPGAKLSAAERRAVSERLRAFQDADAPAARREQLEAILAHGGDAPQAALALVDRRLAEQERKYVGLLDRHLRSAYLERLAALTDEQIAQVQKTRRLWKHYLHTHDAQRDFQKEFLGPAEAVGEILLIDPASLDDAALAEQRRALMEFAEYQRRCHEALGVSIDPTVGKVSPTGIAFPPLDQPPTFADRLSHLERTLVLANTVASPGARRVLMLADEAARQIDVQEAAFVMYGNRIRMLMGTIAWTADPIICACARDHSTDRKDGKASGHSSTIPGKEGFGDRLRRFGARGGSEGAGGGRDGVGYLKGLSYGGGHTGPLYSLKRNVVGVGRRGGVYTSIYASDDALRHPCPVTDNELFMPPGVTRAELRQRALHAIYVLLQREQFGRVHELAESARLTSDFDRMVLRFFKAAVDAERDWALQEIAALQDVGDLFRAKARLEEAKRQFQGDAAFAERSAELEQRLSADDAKEAIRAGELYYKIARTALTESNLKQLIARYGDTEYARAAQTLIDKRTGDSPDANPLIYFFEKNPHLNRYGYLAAGE